MNVYYLCVIIVIAISLGIFSVVLWQYIKGKNLNGGNKK